MLVDSHCHLNFPDFKDDLDGVIARARENGVGLMQTICTELTEFEEIYAIAERYPDVYCSVGVHPNDTGKQDIPAASELIERAARDKVIGIGETGLDYHYETSPRLGQQESFINHIDAARTTGLPLIVHSRDADADTVAILKQQHAQGAFKGLIHCFTSTAYLAEEALELGMYISLAGIVTFKNAESIREVVKRVPLDRLLIETDAPYLAPMPYRGKRNEPAYVRHTNKVIAELKSVSEEECAIATTENFFRLFSKAKHPEMGRPRCA